MMLVALLVLGQSLNLNEAPIDVRDEGARQSTKRAYAINCVGTSVACTQDGGVMRLEVTGGGSGAPTDAEYVTYSANATLSAERVLTSGTNTTVDRGTAGQVKVNVSGTVASATLAATATALAANPADCSAGQYATTIAASGDLTCAQVATSQLSGTVTNGQLASTYSGVGTCTNQFARVLNGNAAPTCATVSLTADVTGTLGQGNGGLGAASLTCGAGAYVTCNGTVCSCSTPAGGSGYATVQDEGSGLTARTILNFAGAGVTCADDTTRTTCTIPGAAGGGTSPLILTFGGF